MTAARRVKPWMWVAGIWIWPAVFNVVERLGQVKLGGWSPPSAQELVFSAGDWLLYAAVTPVIFWISRRWPVVRPHIGRRFAIHLAWALLFCVVWASGGKVLELVITFAVTPDAVRASIANAGAALPALVARNVGSWVLTTLPFGAVVYTTVAGLAHAIEYFGEAREREVQVARLAEQLTGARYAALEAQLNPHFLFNTLNTVTVLVRDGDRTGAVRIVEQLSDILRRTLSRHSTPEVPLGDELALVDTYLDIERARFPDRLRAEVTVPPELARAAVPSFAVQHLVENAIRHGIARREDGGRLTVAARRDGDALDVTVTDDGPGFDGATVPAGHGISNTRERLAALYGPRGLLTIARLAPHGTIATLRVPYRELDGESPRG